MLIHMIVNVKAKSSYEDYKVFPAGKMRLWREVACDLRAQMSYSSNGNSDAAAPVPTCSIIQST
jgi:hypothetical protein